MPSPQCTFGCCTPLRLKITAQLATESRTPFRSGKLPSGQARLVPSRCNTWPKKAIEPRPRPNPAPPEMSVVVPSFWYPLPGRYCPTFVLMKGVNAPSLSTRFTTPAMASEPYCVEAPSRSTSMRSIALEGKAFRSTPLEPGAEPLEKTLSSAVVCRRWPLISTSEWSGERPRSVNGRTISVASVTACFGKFTEGDRFESICVVSVEPDRLSSSTVYTSTGTASSSAAVCFAREPTVVWTGASWLTARLSAMSSAVTFEASTTA